MSHPVPGHTYGENEYPKDYSPIGKTASPYDAMIHPEKAHPKSPLGRLYSNLSPESKKKMMMAKKMQKKTADFMKKNPNKHAPNVKYQDFGRNEAGGRHPDDRGY